MILCFSGTGNSLYAAKCIVRVIDDKILSINEKIKNNIKEKIISDKPFIFVCPTYAWRIPDIVDKYIKENIFEGSDKVYFILTCGAECGNAIYYIRRTCLEKGLKLLGVASVVMPENYILMFNTPDKTEAKKIIQEAEPNINKIAEIIAKEQMFSESKIKFSDKLKSGIINKIFYRFFINAKGFYASDDCTGCKKCTELCSLNNIKIENNKPYWGSNCTHCMACICGCPKLAIEYKNKTEGRTRNYFLE